MKARTFYRLTVAVIFLMMMGIATILWRQALETEAHSCAASLGAAIAQQRAAKFYKQSNDWQVLTSAEVDALTSELHRYDCSIPPWRLLTPARKAGSFLDPWGERFQVAIRREKREGETTASSFHVVVWSKGPDRKSGTRDDLVAPYGDTFLVQFGQIGSPIDDHTCPVGQFTRTPNPIPRWPARTPHTSRTPPPAS
jgi:hypothetical protein